VSECKWIYQQQKKKLNESKISKKKRKRGRKASHTLLSKSSTMTLCPFAMLSTMRTASTRYRSQYKNSDGSLPASQKQKSNEIEVTQNNNLKAIHHHHHHHHHHRVPLCVATVLAHFPPTGLGCALWPWLPANPLSVDELPPDEAALANLLPFTLILEPRARVAKFVVVLKVKPVLRSALSLPPPPPPALPLPTALPLTPPRVNVTDEPTSEPPSDFFRSFFAIDVPPNADIADSSRTSLSRSLVASRSFSRASFAVSFSLSFASFSLSFASFSLSFASFSLSFSSSPSSRAECVV
jgi:hypothetical protein